MKSTKWTMSDNNNFFFVNTVNRNIIFFFFAYIEPFRYFTRNSKDIMIEK